MTWFRVLMRGEGIEMECGDEMIRGFYATRDVRAESQTQAVECAKEAITRELEKYAGNFQNLSMAADEVFAFKRLRLFAKHPAGFTFWMGEDNREA